MAATSRRRTLRYWLEQLHLWIGLILLLPLVMMGITGAVLVYAHDIEHWPGEVGEPASVRLSRPGMANAGAQGGRGGGQQGNSQQANSPQSGPAPQTGPQGSAQGGQAGQARPPAQSPFAGSVQILIDPVSLQVLGNQQGMTGWVRFFHDLHGHLFIPGGLGRELVGWLGVALLVLGCSGLYLWWPKPGQWKGAFKVRRKAKGLRLHRELHGAVGIWSLVIFMLVNFTGVYLAFPQTISAAVNAVWPGRDVRAAVFQAKIEPMRGTAPMGIDEAVALALSRVPDARFFNANLSTRPDQPLRIGLIREAYSDGAPVITVIVDQYRRSIVDVFDPKTMSFGESIITWQRALHYGSGLGGVYRFLVFVAGIVIPIFAVTGFYMWWIKRRNRKAGERARQAILVEAATSGS